MAQKFGYAGRSTREMAEQRRRKGIIYGATGIIAMIIIMYMLTHSDQLGIGGGGLLLLLIIFKVIEAESEKGMKHQSKLQKRAVRGAKGEEKVDEILADLGEDYSIIHDVNSAYGNIDHLVLSKQQGLILIETKAHGGKVDLVDGKILVNGKNTEKDFIAQSLKNTYWLKEKVQKELGISIWIRPIIVFTNAFVNTGRPIKGIVVTNKKYLLRTIERNRGKNSNAELLWERREELVRLFAEEQQMIESSHY